MKLLSDKLFYLFFLSCFTITINVLEQFRVLVCYKYSKLN